ncbi:daptide biosynthesis RiPP recognition protein [Sinomonas susongensis]|uniref:daptide biosynthesis RiPP recognition protein n=1 Tax=Sinomonas susongensis TaxID=1324851 RepID=UPI001FEC32E3|nr:daptide biosynthesis RiPP recognition protein [Sinomonas susongensis]
MDQWITGIPGRIPDHVIFVENPKHSQYAREIAGERSLVFVLDGVESDGIVVPVAGYLEPAGEELLVDGRLSLEIQDYLAIPFLNLVGPTIVRTTTPEDWSAFFDDAGEARTSGHFVSQLSEANAVLAERGFLGGSVDADSPLARLHIASDGAVFNGVNGTRLGRVGDSLIKLRDRNAALRPESVLASAGDVEVLRESLLSRPWIPRYLAALQAWQFITREDRPNVSLVGFGSSVYGAAPTVTLPSPSAPFIIQRAGEHVLLDTKSGRRFKIGPDAAAIVEALSNMRDVQAAASAVARSVGVSTGVAEKSAEAIRARFDQLGIDLFGTRR